MEPINNDTIEGVETFEDRLGKTLTLWNGREVKAFPADPRYNSHSCGLPACCSPVNLQREGRYFNINCKLCDSELVDYEKCGSLSRYTVAVITDDGHVDTNPHPIGKIRHIFIIFCRTCPNCYGSKKEGIFGKKFTHVVEQYAVHVGYTDRPYYSPPMENEIKPKDTYFSRLQTFIDNFDAFQVDVNEAILAGFFRSFGAIRDSVDFFTTVGEFLKEKLGVDKETEKQLLSREIEEDDDWNDLFEEEDNCFESPQELGLSPETILALKDVSRASPLEMFRKIFPTGEECQKACSNFLGIKHEPNAPFKRVLEEFGAAGPFGPLWMAISAAGQVAVESGLVNAKEKPFYEIALALLSHKATRIGKNTPIASEVEKLSKSLESSIDLGKVSSGSSKEIQKASHAVEKFLDIRDLNPPKTGNITLDTAKLLPTQANNVCGWKVGQDVTNRTILGDVPTWSTVRARHWKNKALDHKKGTVKGELKYEPTPENIQRMERGLAPQYLNKETLKTESIELHHEPPQRDGGLFDFEELTIEQHMKKDPHRAGYTNREGVPKQ